MKNDKNFNFLNYVINIVYDDYSTMTYCLFEGNADKIYSIEEVKEKVNEYAITLKNSDLTYSITISELYEIVNPEYKIFADDNLFCKTPYITEEKAEEIKNKYGTENIIFGNIVEYELETPERSIPLKTKLVEKIQDIKYIDVNGYIIKENIEEAIKMLKKLKKIEE